MHVNTVTESFNDHSSIGIDVIVFRIQSFNLIFLMYLF